LIFAIVASYGFATAIDQNLWTGFCPHLICMDIALCRALTPLKQQRTTHMSDKMASHLTTTMLSRRLCTTTKTLERWRANGFGPRFMRVGKRILYSERSVSEWEKSVTVGSNAEAARVMSHFFPVSTRSKCFVEWCEDPAVVSIIRGGAHGTR